MRDGRVVPHNPRYLNNMHRRGESSVHSWRDAMAVFHRLWGEHKALPGYDKAPWVDLHEFLVDQSVQAMLGEPKHPK